MVAAASGQFTQRAKAPAAYMILNILTAVLTSSGAELSAECLGRGLDLDDAALLQHRASIETATAPGMEVASYEDDEDLPFEVALPVETQPVDIPARAADAKPRLWLHIHKAGGTFMCEMAKLAGEKVVQPNWNCNWADHDGWLDSGKVEYALPCAERAAYFRENGYTWGSIERELWPTDVCTDDFDYGVMLREPLALMISIMNFEPEIGRRYLAMVREAVAGQVRGSPSLLERWKIMDNFQTRLLARAIEVPAGMINASHVEQAKKTLQRFQVVHRLEALAISNGSLFQQLGWPSWMTRYLRHKENARNHTLRFSAEEAAWLKELNRNDFALYESLRYSADGLREPSGSQDSV